MPLIHKFHHYCLKNKFHDIASEKYRDEANAKNADLISAITPLLEMQLRGIQDDMRVLERYNCASKVESAHLRLMKSGLYSPIVATVPIETDLLAKNGRWLDLYLREDDPNPIMNLAFKKTTDYVTWRDEANKSVESEVGQFVADLKRKSFAKMVESHPWISEMVSPL